jgi:thioredoxin reductase (NADPH)
MQLTDAAPIEIDALVIGAGPVGLFQVFELGLLDIRAHVIDALPYPGGQPVELYPDKPIYDIPAIPVCTGKELAAALLKQVEPFAPTFHLGQEVSQVEVLTDGRLRVATTQGTRFITKTLFIAAGVGAFQPRTLKVNGMDAFAGRQLLYRAQDPAPFAGQNVVVLGGEDAAVDWAVRLASDDSTQRPANIVLLHRRDVFQAAPAQLQRLHELREGHRLQFMPGQITGFEAQSERLTGLKVTGPDAVTRIVPTDTLLACLGLSPKLGPIAEWGLAIERKQLVVDTEKFATSVPGIYAVGDINTYPGKKKLILCGFHEATLAAFAAQTHIHGHPALLQYTTTSPKLHKLLGVRQEGAGS